MPRPILARTSLLLVAALVLVTASYAAGSVRFAVRCGQATECYLTLAEQTVRLPSTAEGMQARYEAGRALEVALYGGRRGCAQQLSFARGLVRWAEGYDRAETALEDGGRRQALAALARVRQPCRSAPLVSRLPRLPSVPPLVRATPPRTTVPVLDAKLSTLGRTFPGYAAIWVHDLSSGTTASWNADARFPAASTVKLGVLLAVMQGLRRPERSALDYELRALTGWSSNLATNLLVRRIGTTAVEGALRRAGAKRSTFPQGYRVGTARAEVQDQPPLVSGRVTTARDLGRILYVLHGCAFRNAAAVRASGLDPRRCGYALRLLLASELHGNNVGLVRPFVSSRTPVAQKNGWLHDARHTAAIVYLSNGPKIVVVLTYARNLKLVTARRVGQIVMAAVS